MNLIPAFPAWSATTTYSQGQAVLYNGILFVSGISGNVNNVPANLNSQGNGYWVQNERCGDIEAQGQIAAHNYDVVNRGGSPLNLSLITVPAQVTNGVLTAGYRWNYCPGAGFAYSGWTQPMYPAGYGMAVGGMSIVSDATAAHITIDNNLQNGQSLTVNQTQPLYAVGWYMSNSVTWAVTSGPGSINSSGVYTAPASIPVSTSAVIQATSTIDGTKTATTTIPLTGSGGSAFQHVMDGVVIHAGIAH